MSVRLRLQRKGRKKKAFYHIVAADKRAPRDGKIIERFGTYNPMTKPATIKLDKEKALKWVQNGAQPSHTVRAILKYKGVLYKNHLLKGVEKGAITEEKAEKLYEEFIQEKEEQIAKRVERTKEEKEAQLKELSGAPPQLASQEEE